MNWTQHSAGAVTELGLNYRGLQLAETESMRYDCNEGS